MDTPETNENHLSDSMQASADLIFALGIKPERVGSLVEHSDDFATPPWLALKESGWFEMQQQVETLKAALRRNQMRVAYRRQA